jgi:hypothetical protein
MPGQDDSGIERLHGPTGPRLDSVIQAFAISPATAGIACGIAMGLFMKLNGVAWSSPDMLKVVAGSAFLVGAWAYPVALFIGGPSYFLLRDRIPLTPIHSAVVGAIIGGLMALGLFGAFAPQVRGDLLLRAHIGCRGSPSGPSSPAPRGSRAVLSH